MAEGGQPPAGAALRRAVVAVAEKGARRRLDALAVEEPMEIRVAAELGGRLRSHPIAVTMRTPGHDFELAAGFLFSEGVVRSARDVARVAYCESDRQAERNVVEVTLAPGIPFAPERFSRNVFTSSSCGICGKTSLELLTAATSAPAVGEQPLAAEMLRSLPARLTAAQPVFEGTGGLHAAGLFSAAGELLGVREDVGRHNALDKLVGWRFLEATLPASETVLVVSGRASFELVQKAAMAGIPTLVAVGAPSSLAVESAEAAGLTLVGFARADRFNVYAGEGRIAGLRQAAEPA